MSSTRSSTSDDAARELPERLRAGREAKRLSVRALAKRVGVSPSQISAIELGRSQPSAATLYALVAELNLSIDDLIFGKPPRPKPDIDGTQEVPAQHQPISGSAVGPVLRKADRATITLDTGVVWQRLTPDSEPGMEFLHTVYGAGCSSDKDHQMARHAGHEWGLVLSGRLEILIGFDRYELGPGDSISFESMTPHLFRNMGDEPVHAIWFVAGRNLMREPPEPQPIHRRAASGNAP